MDTPETGSVCWQLAGTRLRLRLADQQADIELTLPAAHWGANMALAASILCRLAGASLPTAAQALAGWQPPDGRMRMLTGTGGCHIIDDTYNANPASMQAALDTLRRLPGRHFAILGDMAELGEDAARMHASIDPGNLSGLILVGRHIQSLRTRYDKAVCVADADAAIAIARAWPLVAGDYVLVKASRCMRLERVVRVLTDTNDAV
jgi:UDP-N-acetylmuramoyl-tripeptide--D-alanyl-D-alanine ligase